MSGIIMKYKTIRTIVDKHEQDGGFSFEYTDLNVSIIADEEKNLYLRVNEKTCAAEGNGRPVTNSRDYCYPIEDVKAITPDNWKKAMIAGFGGQIQLRSESYSDV
ncbi:MAG: hypothetical protein J6I68_01335 [Butyrivibrio sp.]|uniref:hypothetical protein n=1 Tax=Butyrivibrio sp. TaxID=28121 RepID=UPI001B2695D6|nr:hypothetical protein [Butyrivibrio sp.]MBO5623229.1 hypothetical protein [Butyrivibrio sp.]MBP3781872.1 hypothetical protein [Butyrivibrio sp.]MBP3813257.1 hypothetical protein [Butyrivibrio sp.]